MTTKYLDKGYYCNFALDNADNLIITPTKQARKDKKALLNPDRGSNDRLWDLLEDFLCSGWDWIRPEQIGALTDAPIISNDAQYNDDGDLISINNVWAYVDYMLYDPVEKLFEDGRVIFMNADNC